MSVQAFCHINNDSQITAYTDKEGQAILSLGEQMVTFIPPDKLPELIFKLQACLPKPETETIRLHRHVIISNDDLTPETIAKEILRRMGTQL